MEMSLGSQLSPGRDPPPPPQPLPPEEDETAELHHVAQKAYADGRYKDALNSLLKAKTSAATASSPDDEAAAVPPGLLTNLVTVKRAMGDLDAAATMAELEAIHRKAKEGGDFDHADHGPLIYNLALVYFLHRRFVQAEALLRPLYQAISGLGSLGSSPGSPSSASQQKQQEEALLYKHVLPLLAVLANELHMPARAIKYAAQMEKAAASSGTKDGLMSDLPTLLRAHAFVNARQHKQFKKDLKSTGLSPRVAVSFEFMRANLEYLKGTHKKATKLLLMAVQNRGQNGDQQQQPPPTVESLNVSDPYVMSLYYNNLGCINMATGRPNAARFNFHDAINLHNTATTAGGGGRMAERQDYLLRLKNCELVYNLGVNLLHIGQHREAFETLLKTTALMAKSPHWWLHLAECCIAHNSEKKEAFKELVAVPPAASASSKKQRGQQQQESSDAAPGVTFMLKGASAHQKIVLVRQKPTTAANNGQRKDGKTPSHVPSLTLQFAHHCLQNAAFNLDAASTGNEPNPQFVTSRVTVLKAAILLKQSYVALCLDNPTGAFRYAKQLLDLGGSGNSGGVPPAGHRVMARLYAGEALILLDRISDAVAYLDPHKVQDVNFEDSRNSDEVNAANAGGGGGGGGGGSGGTPSGGGGGGNNNRGHSAAAASAAAASGTASELIASRALFTYNLAVAFLVRGETDRAGEMLDALAAQGNQHKISDLVLMARLYVLVKRGKLGECRKIVRRQATLRTKISADSSGI